MFLDDQLYLYVKSRKISDYNEDNLVSIINDCYKICEDWWKPQFSTKTNYKEGKIIMDKVFKFWDMFVAKLEKEKHPFLCLYVLKDVSYKDNFMSNPELKEIYDKGLIDYPNDFDVI